MARHMRLAVGIFLLEQTQIDDLARSPAVLVGRAHPVGGLDHHGPKTSRPAAIGFSGKNRVTGLSPSVRMFLTLVHNMLLTAPTSSFLPTGIAAGAARSVLDTSSSTHCPRPLFSSCLATSFKMHGLDMRTLGLHRKPFGWLSSATAVIAFFLQRHVQSLASDGR